MDKNSDRIKGKKESREGEVLKKIISFLE